ncbi:MAG: GvpL/GvpF family gas vesicle protein [Candidatus Wallbacteria bacterium]|nr:GvpL/GvpF family gas vesicle protein [Candidatus Wallbacteria bacterium]
MEDSCKEGKYIYCIIASSGVQSFGPLGIGGRGDELHTVVFNDVSAVVSNSPIKTYPVSRENVLTYERAIEEVMKERAVLPVRFNTIAESADKLKKILAKEHDKFVELLKKIEGKKELGLKVIFKDDLIYKEILEKSEDIRKLKSAISAEPLAKTYFQRMEIGKMVEAALQKEKNACKEEIINTLSPIAQEVKVNNSYGELMIINAAFLIEKEREAEFDRNVQELSEKESARLKFKYTGNLPPFNFVNVVIRTAGD